MDPSLDTSTLPHDNKANILVGVVCLVCSIATVAVGLRFYTRGIIIKQIGADDYLVLVAMLLALATGISQCINTRNGLGKHTWDLAGPQEIMDYLQGFYVSITLYNAGLMLVKLTFLMQYYRVLPVKKMRTICIVAMVIIGSWSLSQVLVGIFICDPIPGFWNSSLNAKCIPNLPQWYINAAGNIATDVAIFVLPLPVLGHLNLPKAQRLVLIGIFSLGFFTCAISVIRIKYLKQGGDFSYENVEGSSWSITELCSGVTCACLPTLRPLVSKWIPSLSTRLHKSKSSKRRSGSHATDAERGHTRGSSTGSNVLPRGIKDMLYLDMLRNDSGEQSDALSASRTSKGSMYEEEPTSATPLRPANAHLPIQRPTEADWARPTVITKIGTSNSPRLDSDRDRPSNEIRVKKDFVMEQTTYSAI
ncbi:hypothetical protein F4778DRAFT_793852 [Xylariomycetidae sp. FL2044]|nr:hypothetical protein F4778DRAFT_793852 [Xylariomycetidae sp. FL2044]